MCEDVQTLKVSLLSAVNADSVDIGGIGRPCEDITSFVPDRSIGMELFEGLADTLKGQHGFTNLATMAQGIIIRS